MRMLMMMRKIKRKLENWDPKMTDLASWQPHYPQMKHLASLLDEQKKRKRRNPKPENCQKLNSSTKSMSENNIEHEAPSPSRRHSRVNYLGLRNQARCKKQRVR